MVKFKEIKEMIKSKFLKLESKLDWIQSRIQHIYLGIGKLTQYYFPNSNVRYAKIISQDKNTNLDKSYSDLDLGFLYPNWNRT